MALGIYVGVGSKARKVSKLYVGVGGKARRVRAVYVGVGGIARLCYTSMVALYGTTSLSVKRGYMAATTIGNYALFGGGVDSEADPKVYYSTVDAYNASLTRSTPTALSVKRSVLAATTVGSYALFAGGNIENTSGDTTYYTTVDAYNASLTRSTPTVLSAKRSRLAATTVGNYALFAGGYPGEGAYSIGGSTKVDAYNTSLTRSTPTALSIDKQLSGATTVGNYALFAGGMTGILSYTDVVDAYNASLTRSTPTALSEKRDDMAATTVGNYALFAGGSTGIVESTKTADAYNTSLTRSIPAALSYNFANEALTLNNYAVIPNISCTDLYDTSLTKISITPSSGGENGAVIGKYALFSPVYNGTQIEVYISG